MFARHFFGARSRAITAGLVSVLVTVGLVVLLGGALQEVCSAQWTFLANNLAYMGFSNGWFFVSNPYAACGSHGNVVLWGGGCVGGSFYTCTSSVRYPTNIQSPTDPECGGVTCTSNRGRGYVCGKAVFPAYLTCSTHITNRNDGAFGVSFKQYQEDYYHSGMEYVRGLGGFVEAAGDFNRDPAQTAPWANFWEGDGFFTKQATTDDGHALDYIYASSNAWCPYGEPAWIRDSTHSDHRLYLGFLHVNC